MWSGKMNLPMSCSRPAVWASSCSRSDRPAATGDLARVARDGGAVAGRHAVPDVERVQQGADHPELEAGQLVGARLELFGAQPQFALALLRAQQLGQQVLEAREDDHEQGDRRHPDLHVDERDDDDEQRAEQLGRQQRHERVPGLVGQRGALQPALVARGEGEVQGEREEERGEDEDVEERVGARGAGRLDGGVEGEAREEREPRVDDEVLAQVVGRLAVAQPADEDRDRSDQRGGRPAEQDHRQHEGEEAARDLELRRARPGRGEVAGDGAGGEGGEEVGAPGGGSRCRDRERGGAAQGEQLGEGERTGRLPAGQAEGSCRTL